MKYASLFLLLISFASCTKETAPPAPQTATAPPAPKVAAPSIDEAKSVIEASPAWSEYEFTNAAYSLPMKRAAMNEPAQQAAEDLKKGGWIRFSGDSVQLTDKAAGDRRFLVRPNDVVDLVPLAKKDVVAVTSVTEREGSVVADLEWKWVANEIGTAFRRGAVFDRYRAPQRARATLEHNGTAWEVVRVEPSN